MERFIFQTNETGSNSYPLEYADCKVVWAISFTASKLNSKEFISTEQSDTSTFPFDVNYLSFKLSLVAKQNKSLNILCVGSALSTRWKRMYIYCDHTFCAVVNKFFSTGYVDYSDGW